jgi:DNA-binding transcriptional LysR family regulator
MSHALGRLRRLFDDQLFTRHAGGISPTARARELAGPLADALEQVRRVVSPPAPFDPATLSRVFRVATHDHGIAVVLAKALPRLRQQAPNVDLDCIAMSYAELTAAFDRGTVDFACGAFVGYSAARIERIPLFEDELVGIAPEGHPVFDGRIDLARLTRYPHVAVSPGQSRVSPVDEALRNAGANRRIVVSTPSALAVPALVSGTDLIAVVPHRFAAAVAARHGLRSFALPLDLPAISCDLLVPKALAQGAEFQWIADLIRGSVAREQGPLLIEGS